VIGLALFILYWAIFVYSVVLHEVAHGYVALRLGDPTAQRAGRITLDPIPHIDPLQSILLPLVLFVATQGAFVFGGAKPVPVNPYNYRNMRAGIIMDSAAGPLTNLLLGMFFAILLTISRAIAGGGLPATGRLFACCMMINVFLAAFNMLPIPPLDGSHVLSTLLPHGLREAYERLRSLGYLLLFGLLMLPVTSDLIYGALGAAVRGFMLLMGVRDLPQGAFNPMSLLRDDT